MQLSLTGSPCDRRTGQQTAQRVDLHMHSTYSDGSETIYELLTNIKKSGISTFALTDHDTASGAEKLASMIPQSLRFIRGIEFSCCTPAGKCHILGYNYDSEDRRFQAAVQEGRALRDRKLKMRLTYLADKWQITFDKNEMEYLYGLNCVGKPHLAELIVKKGLAGDITEAIQHYINGCRAEDDRIDGKMAVKAILSAGGIPVWAHPLGGENERHLTETEFDRQLTVLMAAGIKGLECYYSRYTTEEEHFLLEKAQRQQLYISGGSDYHGTNKTIPLGRLNAADEIVPEGALTILDIL